MTAPRSVQTALAVCLSLCSFVVPWIWISSPKPRPALPTVAPLLADPPRLLAWNDLGMHCMDPDFAVFSILPPFNNIHAQLVLNGDLVTSASHTLTYEAVADPSGSVNRTSNGKTDFWDHVQAYFGVSLPVDEGLAGFRMPGSSNTPQAMSFASNQNWFAAEGIPITPIDDVLAKNPYPMMRIVARNGGGQVVASTMTTVPVSQELECSVCHSSGSSPEARPLAGWVFDSNPLRDDRLNILRLHDERHLGQSVFDQALVASGYQPAGLLATATGGTPILCARCHGSNALPGTGIATISPLTRAIHSRHASVRSPDGRTLDEDSTREACYSCHPGRDTQCLRGAMGKAIGADGQHSMHCQSCHGGLAEVGALGRVGWLDQPSCQNCHAGTATQNPGEIRYTTVFDATGQRRTPTTAHFATDPDVPAPGFSLYRFSDGHGGLQCSACHGPPHAIYPTSQPNDNIQSQQAQGHEGTITDCSVCHDQVNENTPLLGPHGMHPVDHEWVDGWHGDQVDSGGLNQCRACHGTDSRGTALSLAQGSRSYNTEFGTKTYFRGQRVTCYDCHDGPNSEQTNTNVRPTAVSSSGATSNDVPLVIPLVANDPENQPLTFRIISQPTAGSVALSGSIATFLPRAGFTGMATFTFAAFDGEVDSTLGTVTLMVTPAIHPSVTEFGFAWPGSGGFAPRLAWSGPAMLGAPAVLEIRQGLGGALAVLGIGRSPATQELPFGGVLRIGQIFAVSAPLTLAGTGPGAGTLPLPFTLPSDLPSGRYTLQAFLTDPLGPGGFTSTNGIEVVVP